MKPKILTKTPPRIQKHSLGSSIPEIINATSKYPLFQSKRVKILDENLNLLTDKPLQLLSSHPQCYIIGFIGKAGVGKSTLANLLTRSEGSRNESTHGIDLWMLPQGIIILDTFPIFSRSVYNRNKHESVLGADDWMQRNANNLAHFLFSVCHVVIAVSDRVDEKFWGFLKNVAVNKSGDFAPRIVACINKQMPESFDNVCSANEVFGGFFSDDACDISLSRAYPHYQPTPNFWMLPSQSLTISIDIDIFENAANLLKLNQLPDTWPAMARIFSIQITSLARSVDGDNWEKVKWFMVSERDWFKSACGCAERIRKQGNDTRNDKRAKSGEGRRGGKRRDFNTVG